MDETRNSFHGMAELDAAYAVLGLARNVNPDHLVQVFRQQIKAARPDRIGGDAERYRQIIAAYRLIQHNGGARLALPAPRTRPPAPPVISLTPLEALNGAVVRFGVGDRMLDITVPPGMRTGHHIRLAGAAQDGATLYVSVLIRPSDGLMVLGDDLYMEWSVAPRLLADGGRVEVATHAGPRGAWVVRNMPGPVRLRLKGLGLPARGKRPCGHLFVTLVPSVDVPSAAEDLLDRFARVWTRLPIAA